MEIKMVDSKREISNDVKSGSEEYKLEIVFKSGTIYSLVGYRQNVGVKDLIKNYDSYLQTNYQPDENLRYSFQTQVTSNVKTTHTDMVLNFDNVDLIIVSKI